MKRENRFSHGERAMIERGDLKKSASGRRTSSYLGREAMSEVWPARPAAKKPSAKMGVGQRTTSCQGGNAN